MNNLLNYITPSLINAYYICSRKAWLHSRNINPSVENNNISIGKIIDETSYSREKKSITIENMRIDFIEESPEGPLVCEIKKSSAGRKASIMQLAYYLYKLKNMGLVAKGRLLIPKEKKKETIELTDELKEEIKTAISNIQELIKKDLPPEPKKNTFCKTCAYYEFCWI